jgi:Phage integrase, N-terminal SAM-like domain
VGRRSACCLTYGCVFILARTETRAYTPATVVGEAPPQICYPPAARGGGVIREPSPLPARPPKLLDRVRAALRARHYSRRTEDAYAAWIRRFILFQGKRPPAEMGAAEVTQFLSWLAVESKVAASIQNQALSAPRL